jgi:CBS domain-containing protein
LIRPRPGHSDRDAGRVRLCDIRGRPVVSAEGVRLGRVSDLVAEQRGDELQVTHVVLRHGRGGLAQVPIGDVAALGADGARLRDGASASTPPAVDTALLLGRDVLDVQVVDIAGRRIRRVSDVWLRWTADGLCVSGVDTGWRAILRRLGVRHAGADAAVTVIPWPDIHITASRRHELRLQTPAAALHRLSAAELSELVTRLPLEHGAGVLETVDRAHAASAISAAQPLTAGRMVEAIEPGAAGEILTAMPIDDAVAALRHVSGTRGAELLRRVPTARAGELRRLLELPARTAGGLMTTEIRTAFDDEPIEAIQRRLAAAPPRLEGLTTVFVVDADGRVTGALPPSRLLSGSAPGPVTTLALDTPLEGVIDAFALEDVLALPVVDEAGRPLGAVAIDDVLEELLVERLPRHRRRYRRARIRERAPA